MKQAQGREEKPLSFRPVWSLSENWQRVISYVFLVAVVVEASFLYIQWYEVVSTKKTEGLSIPAFATLLGMNVIWFLYAVLILGSWPVLISSLLYLIGSLGLILTIVTLR